MQHNVPKPGRNVHNLLHSAVGESQARAEVKNAQVVVGPVSRKREKGRVVDQLAADKSKLAEGPRLGEDGRNGLIADEPAFLKVNLENIGAVFGKGKDGLVG